MDDTLLAVVGTLGGVVLGYYLQQDADSRKAFGEASAKVIAIGLETCLRMKEADDAIKECKADTTEVRPDLVPDAFTALARLSQVASPRFLGKLETYQTAMFDSTAPYLEGDENDRKARLIAARAAVSALQGAILVELRHRTLAGRMCGVATRVARPARWLRDKTVRFFD